MFQRLFVDADFATICEGGVPIINVIGGMAAYRVAETTR